MEEEFEIKSWTRIIEEEAVGPKIDIQQSWWAMGNLGENGKEWTMEQKFDKIAEAGFTGICGFIPKHEEMDKWHHLLDRYHLNFSGLAFPYNIEDMIETLKLAKQFGRVQYINSQVMDAFVIDGEAVRLLDDLLLVSDEANIPNLIETHRGTVTQDLIRTAAYIKELPHLRLMIDLSHYVVAGEMNGGNEETNAKAEVLIDQLLARSAGMHARISNGEQVQIDIGHDGDHPMLNRFTNWWQKGMKHWLQQAESGEVFPFCMELGPPNYYGITRRDEYKNEIEISDRWQQALLLKRIVAEQWENVSKEFSYSDKLTR